MHADESAVVVAAGVLFPCSVRSAHRLPWRLRERAVVEEHCSFVRRCAYQNGLRGLLVVKPLTDGEQFETECAKDAVRAQLCVGNVLA
jgi:hypothetical protein